MSSQQQDAEAQKLAAVVRAKNGPTRAGRPKAAAGAESQRTASKDSAIFRPRFASFVSLGNSCFRPSGNRSPGELRSLVETVSVKVRRTRTARRGRKEKPLSSLIRPAPVHARDTFNRSLPSPCFILWRSLCARTASTKASLCCDAYPALENSTAPSKSKKWMPSNSSKTN